MLCRTTWHPTAAQQCLPLCFLKSTSTFEFGVNCFINIVPLSSHYFNTWILFLFKQDFFFFYVFFCAACACFKGHLLVCHSEICRGSSLNGHLSEKVTAPPDSSSRSHFQHACGRWLIIHSLRFRLSPAQGAAHIHIPPCKMYTIVCLPCLCLCQLYVLS